MLKHINTLIYALTWTSMVPTHMLKSSGAYNVRLKKLMNIVLYGSLPAMLVHFMLTKFYGEMKKKIQILFKFCTS